MTNSICLKCGHKWLKRLSESKRPLACPNCHSTTWDSEGYAECEVCKRKYLLITNHHKDGNKKNNNKSNIIKLCINCHYSLVHHGVEYCHGKEQEPRITKLRKYKDNPDIIRKLKELKTYLYHSIKQRKQDEIQYN